MAPSSGELWGSYMMPPTLEVDFLLPNGIIITLNCAREASLLSLKEVLLKEAKKYPLYEILFTQPDEVIEDEMPQLNMSYNSSYDLGLTTTNGESKKVPIKHVSKAGHMSQPDFSRTPSQLNKKSSLFKSTKLAPLELSDFVFVSPTQDGTMEEFYDESRRLCDIRLFLPLLKLTKLPNTLGTEKRLLKTYDFELGIAMGVPTGKLEETKEPEIVESRRNILTYCRDVVKYRDSRGPLQSALYLYPPDCSGEVELPPYLAKYLDNKDDIILCVWVLSPWGQHQKYTVKVHYRMTPKEIIGASVKKKTRAMHLRPFQQSRCIQEYQESYVLKVCGREEYLLEEVPLFRYQYVKECLSNGLIPQFMLMSKEGLFVTVPTPGQFIFPPSLNPQPPDPLPPNGPAPLLLTPTSAIRYHGNGGVGSHSNEDSSRGSSFSGPSSTGKGLLLTSSNASTGSSTCSVWQMEKPFRFRLASATYINAKDVDKIYVRAGLYHGSELLCRAVESKSVNILSPSWFEWLSFDLTLPHLPRCAKLCLALCSLTLPRKKKKDKEERCCLAWGNIGLFNHRGTLISGKVNMHFWQTPMLVEEEFLNPLGTLGGNPNRDAPCIQLEFESYDNSTGHSKCLTFPTLQQIEEFAGFIEDLNKSLRSAGGMGSGDPSSGEAGPDAIDPWFDPRLLPPPDLSDDKISDPLIKNQKELMRLKGITELDPLCPLSEQDKEFVWSIRHKAHLVPDSLVVLSKSVRWSNREEVSQLYLLLRKWPKISLEKCFQLLEGMSADVYIREFAVSQLDTTLSDQQLHQYMMQLVQVIKYESYADSSLGRFLLKRSLMNKKLGHLFYWLIRSESQYAVDKHYILLLEAYCRGCGSYFKTLIKQVEATEKLSKLSELLKMKEDLGPKERLKFFHETLRQTDYLEALQNISSPLNNSAILGDLIVDECKIMSSAKKPFWLVWTNRDPLVSISCSSPAPATPTINSYPSSPTLTANGGVAPSGSLKKNRSSDVLHDQAITNSSSLQKRKKSKEDSLPLLPSVQGSSPDLGSESGLKSSNPASPVVGPPAPLKHGLAANQHIAVVNELIFKLGDDLRQDMLTLQTIRIMDEVWKRAGLDLKVMPYGCLSTAHHSGLIEAVREAKTVLGIQKEAAGKVAATLQVTVGSRLHRWIRERNNSLCSYERAIDTFTKSCAGYSVATFILGIGDRHPDNIMINERGQIFHIDFGHFLHHFKKKYGIKRERVPFVLTEDFIRVIAKGAENPVRSKEFERFQELCGEAYLCIRRQANLFITLFTMMLSAGIPELQSVDDIEYLRTTLAVEEKDEARALDYFQTQLCEAYGGAWTTKLDWFFHGMRHF